MGWIGELLTEAGPWAGWVLSGLLGTGIIFLYATDRLISRGRFTSQATHYEQQMELQSEHHRQSLDDARRHFQELIAIAQERAESFRDDRDYWREVGLDLMNAVAASVGRDEGT